MSTIGFCLVFLSFHFSTFVHLWVHTYTMSCVCVSQPLAANWSHFGRERERERERDTIFALQASAKVTTTTTKTKTKKKRRTLYDNVWLASWWHFVQNRLTKQNRRRRCLVIVSVIKIILVFFFELLNELCLPSGANDDHDDSDGVEFRLVPYSSGKEKKKRKWLFETSFNFKTYIRIYFFSIYIYFLYLCSMYEVRMNWLSLDFCCYFCCCCCTIGFFCTTMDSDVEWFLLDHLFWKWKCLPLSVSLS